ncbi:transporter, cation-chloride cotransporter (CCC) family (TC 2.A.30) [Arenibacter nanhaiticus]|uniref:Transporter, cation-chloride cotransporter (CCC) family (TC 2.A.30) n=1 Tax=Arenibacter nanhaiticus TaxID=558155 RepID=A0A1M6J9D2_9FLAO|nr:amino acid permease [Arenibacter nanhaiticus]SHJ43264.1 transporter, cation-chloride cotransporter (CCC) family (TC 2.A.30) [Arenibacter nanhaiticus]
MNKKTFGTFAGVFTPTTLTILGVIMYIRQPWVVGNAGVLGAIGIVLLAVAITLTTALSLSSITTNVRIGSGGAFSLISQSLGLEIGGAIGIPFYFAQAIAVAMYIFGFREGLQILIPNVNPVLLDLCVFGLVMAIAFISTSFAFKIQYVILGIIVLSLVSIYGSLFVNELDFNFEWTGNYPGSIENDFGGSSFWIVFAVFFPAVTGVMAGANMSGDLTNPRKSIPLGTLSSVLLTTIIYISLIFVAAVIASPDELAKNYNVFIDKALFGPIVLAGLLGATLSSALGSFVGAPRILLALGEKNILPKSQKLAKLSKKGEPVNAMLVTAVIVLFGISLRNLNTIAPLLTMFFMITYAMVNVVALVEQTLGLPSYRPTLKIPLIVPAIGAFGSIAIMFILNVIVALFSLIFILLFYLYLVKMNIKSAAGDSRSGLFTALAEWATKKTNALRPQREVRSWRPDLLIPVTAPRELRSSYKLIQSIIYPKGSIKVLSLRNENEEEQKNIESFLNNAIKKFKENELSASYTVIDNTDFNTTINVSMQSLNAAFFKPNIVFVSVDSLSTDYSYYDRLLLDAKKNSFGAIIYIPFSSASLAIEKTINLWMTNIPVDWKETFSVGNNNLSTLISLLICRNWKGLIEVHILNNNPKLTLSPNDIEDLRTMVRFPKKTTIDIKHGDLMDNVNMEKNSDINVFCIQPGMPIETMVKIVNQSRISAIFCADSEYENVLV